MLATLLVPITFAQEVGTLRVEATRPGTQVTVRGEPCSSPCEVTLVAGVYSVGWEHRDLVSDQLFAVPPGRSTLRIEPQFGGAGLYQIGLGAFAGAFYSGIVWGVVAASPRKDPTVARTVTVAFGAASVLSFAVAGATRERVTFEVPP